MSELLPCCITEVFGAEDFDPLREIRDRLCEVSGSGPHQYALTWGAQNFREALEAKGR